ncbi:unnamed protein product [marine sediment metagenome]|uniref:Uncharacterized protein n=1 Tax=marine sediment metagenome TaxID=412755 RepID=X1T978_9ZZZZ
MEHFARIRLHKAPGAARGAYHASARVLAETAGADGAAGAPLAVFPKAKADRPAAVFELSRETMRALYAKDAGARLVEPTSDVVRFDPSTKHLDGVEFKRSPARS